MERGSPEADRGAGLTRQDTPDLAGLVVAHHATVYRYACRLCGCPTEAEDLSQQTYLIAQQKLHQLRESNRACAWLLKIVRNCFLKSIRRSRPIAALDMDLVLEDVSEPEPAGEEIDREELAAALAELPEEFRLILLMFYFEELSYQSIAEELEIPAGTVMSRLSRAKAYLRRRLTAHRTTARVTLSPKSARNVGADDGTPAVRAVT